MSQSKIRPGQLQPRIVKAKPLFAEKGPGGASPPAAAPKDSFEPLESALISVLDRLAHSSNPMLSGLAQTLEAGVEQLFDAGDPVTHHPPNTPPKTTRPPVTPPPVSKPPVSQPPPASGDIATRYPDRVKQMNLRQHYGGDCSMAVIANMILLATGKTPGEQGVVDRAVREGLGTPGDGMNPPNRLRLLKEYGLNVHSTYHATVDDLARAVAAGRVVNVAVSSSTLRNNDTRTEGPLGHVINVVGVRNGGAQFEIVDTGQWPPGMRWVSRAVMAAAMNGNDSIMQST